MPLTSANMGLPIPVVGTDPSPIWAELIASCLTIIDGHDHSLGSGTKVLASSLNITSDISMQQHNLTLARSIKFAPQSAQIVLATDLGCLYVYGTDLWFVDGVGNQVRITQSGSVTGSAGTITGLPSGTASASFSAGTFSFQSATLTPATLSTGPLVLGRQAVGTKTITISPNAGQASDYSLTFPAASPTVDQNLRSDGSGNFAWVSDVAGRVPIGGVVATFPNLTGAYSSVATTVADAAGWVKCIGQTLADATSGMNGQTIPNINNSVFLMGSTTSGTASGSNTKDLSHNHPISITLPDHTHNLSANGGALALVQSYFSGQEYLYLAGASSYSNVTFAPRDNIKVAFNQVSTQSSSAENAIALAGRTDGVTATIPTISGNTGAMSLSTSFDIRPSYVSAVYLMRVK